jgi:hypothetical protein
LVPDEFIPRQDMKFDDLEEAYEYYCDYAKMAGFDVWKGRKSPEVQWLFCDKEGYNDSSRVDKQKEKGSMRIGCKAYVKVKLDPKVGCWYYDALDLDHNHRLLQEKRMTRFMNSHKTNGGWGEKLMEVMTELGCSTKLKWTLCLSCTEGGISGHSRSGIWEIGTRSVTMCTMLDSWKLFVVPELLWLSNCAIGVCRKVEFMHEERSDDIPKLLEFFRHCKSANEYFYWDA